MRRKALVPGRGFMQQTLFDCHSRKLEFGHRPRVVHCLWSFSLHLSALDLLESNQSLQPARFLRSCNCLKRGCGTIYFVLLYSMLLDGHCLSTDISGSPRQSSLSAECCTTKQILENTVEKNSGKVQGGCRNFLSFPFRHSNTSA